MLNCDIRITNLGTDGVESPYFIPARQLVRIRHEAVSDNITSFARGSGLL